MIIHVTNSKASRTAKAMEKLLTETFEASHVFTREELYTLANKIGVEEFGMGSGSPTPIIDAICAAGSLKPLVDPDRKTPNRFQLVKRPTMKPLSAHTFMELVEAQELITAEMKKRFES